MKYCLLLTFFICFSVYSKQGIIIVLEAPLLKKPNRYSEVVQWVSKGQSIYIHNKHFSDPKYKKDYSITEMNIQDLDELWAEGYEDDIHFDRQINPNQNVTKDYEIKLPDQSTIVKATKNYDQLASEKREMILKQIRKLDESRKFSKFYQTLDRNGDNAFIPKEFVKIVFNDTRENKEDISRFSKDDPTDYRLIEPIDPNFPFLSTKHYQASFQLGGGTAAPSRYETDKTVVHEEYGKRKSFQIAYSKHFEFDHSQRLFYGLNIEYASTRNNFTLNDQNRFAEIYSHYSFGPTISYIGHRETNFRMIQTLAIQPTYHSAFVTMTKSNGEREQRAFNGFSYGAKIQNSLEWHMTNKVYLITQGEIAYNFRHQLEATSTRQTAYFPSEWSESDRISVESSLNFALTFGIRADY